jgi:1-acyl-sn-glycerol-3-phosphate acyltransferase
MKIWAECLLALNGIIYRVKYESAPDPKTPYIICPNHCSYLDIILLYCIFPNYTVFMGKQELSKAPLFNIFFKRMNILVDRKRRISAHRAFIRAGMELEQKHSVVIFPEGTIPPNAPKLKVFKNGAFRLAIEKQVPILPVTFLNNWKFLGTGAFFRSAGRPGLAKVVVHHPVTTDGMNEESLVLLRTKVFNTIQSELDKYMQDK